MSISADLLKPIDGNNPSGVNVRYDPKHPIFDQINEARRQDDGLEQGNWRQDRKLANYPLVIKLTRDALATKTKDLRLAAWLTEAMLCTDGFAGLSEGLNLCQGLVSDFWETVYPVLDEDDEEERAASLDWLGSSLEVPLKKVPLVRAGYDWFKYTESRLVGYEAKVQGDREKKLRADRVADGKLAPELFDKAFAETPKAFYVQSVRQLDACLGDLKALEEACDKKFRSAPPSFAKLEKGIEEVRRTVHGLLQKKREVEPDAVEEMPAAAATSRVEKESGNQMAAESRNIVMSVLTTSESSDRREIIASIGKAAAVLRQREPHSPAPCLMMRGLRWGELRAAVDLSDPNLLEAPSVELRQHLKRLSLDKKWNEVLETAENAMSLPCSRAWLDLQRYAVQAYVALGSEYESIASAICSELRTLLQDLPQLIDATLMDDSPTANSETKAWLLSLMQPHAAETSFVEDKTEIVTSGLSSSQPLAAPSWPAKPIDSYIIAREALKAGEPEKAFRIMQKEIAGQRSGRGRFERTLQLTQLCIAAGKEGIAQPLLDDLAAAIETHKLDDWEDQEMLAGALETIMKESKKVQGNTSERQKLFERICRLDPVRALTAG